MVAPVVTTDSPRVVRLGNTQFGLITGMATAASYDTAHPAVTAITGKFRTSIAPKVMTTGESSLGYTMRWDDATSSFKAFVAGVATAAAAAAITVTASPFAYTNSSTGPQVVTVTGGTVSSITLTRGGTTTAALATATPFTITAEVGDVVTVTYTAAPTMTSFPLGSPVDVEAANTTNIGSWDFIAVGLIGL